jgi:hypothetical protein
LLISGTPAFTKGKTTFSVLRLARPSVHSSVHLLVHSSVLPSVRRLIETILKFVGASAAAFRRVFLPPPAKSGTCSCSLPWNGRLDCRLAARASDDLGVGSHEDWRRAMVCRRRQQVATDSSR